MRIVDEANLNVAPRADGGNNVTIIHEEGDYTTPDGFFHRGGVHRVRAFYTDDHKSYARAKTFKGETAWMKAERLFDDLVFQAQRS